MLPINWHLKTSSLTRHLQFKDALKKKKPYSGLLIPEGQGTLQVGLLSLGNLPHSDLRIVIKYPSFII